VTELVIIFFDGSTLYFRLLKILTVMNKISLISYIFLTALIDVLSY